MDEDARFELLRRLFALITAEAEDAAATAADGHGRDVSDDRLYELAVALHAVGEKIAVMSDAVVAILQSARPPLPSLSPPT